VNRALVMNTFVYQMQTIKAKRSFNKVAESN